MPVHYCSITSLLLYPYVAAFNVAEVNTESAVACMAKYDNDMLRERETCSDMLRERGSEMLL